MTSSPLRFGPLRGALARFAGSLLIIAIVLASVFPMRAAAQAAPRIVSVDVSGNVHIPTDKILAVVTARPGQAYDPKVVQADLQRIFALGYFADQATPLIRQRPTGIAITYRVIENPVVTKITFAGNTHVPSDTLSALMDTSVGQVLNTATLKQDFLKINSYYDRIGYGGQLATHIKDINIAPTGALAVNVQEGLTVGKVVVGGDAVLPPNVILPALNVKAGAEYSDALRDKDYDAINKLYDKYGLIVGSFDGGIDPTSIDEKAGTANVKYDIYVARVYAVQITGNTKTKDQVIRRQLRLRPGQIVTKQGIQVDEERLNNTQFFSKVDVNAKPPPSEIQKKDPGAVVIVWTVTEQKTASASLGAGYSGGLTGQGLYGTIGFSDNNLHGTGNGVSLQLERGARSYVTQASVSIPYFGKTAKSQRYSLGASVYANGYTYFYPVYSTASCATSSPSPSGSVAPCPVTLLPENNAQLLNGVASTSTAKSAGISVNVGRRLSDYIQAGVGISVSNVSNSTTVPSPYFFQTSQPNVLPVNTPNNPFTTPSNNTGSFGINATSIANINTGVPYRQNTAAFTLQTDPAATVDDIFNPRRGVKASLSETISSPSIGSNFSFTQSVIDIAKYFPVAKNATLALHGAVRGSTGVIPPSALFTFSDQELRGYQTVFYGTDTVLGQVELRQPLTADRKFSVALFADEGGYRVRGAQPLLDPYTNRIIGYPGNWSYRGDYGFGLRFDVPQLNLHTIRIDFARGPNGNHTSFGIGQSF